MYTLAKTLFAGGAGLRARRARYKNYTYGRQWDDTVPDDCGFAVSEGEALRRQGREPITNNLIRRAIKGVVGRYRAIADEGRDAATAELDARTFEEFLISGCAIQRVDPGGRGLENVSPDRFFVNAFADPLGRDIDAVGMLHDWTLAQVLSAFATNSPRRLQHIRRLYQGLAEQRSHAPDTGTDTVDDAFGQAADPRHCRVIEVWRSEPVVRQRGPQMSVATRWRYAYYAPTGELLQQGTSPYAHAAHPFAVKFYPLTDGEVHSFVEDMIEQQRYVNRLVSAIHHILQCSAKGVLLFPRDALDASMTWQEVAHQWARPDGVIPINSRAVGRPEQLSASGTSADAYRLLELQMQLLADVSGVSDPLLGKPAASATTGSALYQAQVDNATIALQDIFAAFNAFTAHRDTMM